MSNEVLYTIEQAAAVLDCSVSTINRLVKQKRLIKVYLTPSIKRGGCPRITKESVETHLENVCKKRYSEQCTEASTAKRSSVWQRSTNEKTRRITGACGNAQTAQELGEKLGVL